MTEEPHSCANYYFYIFSLICQDVGANFARIS